eukprot:6199590-Pleurochrysis_carterae.AAC.1
MQWKSYRKSEISRPLSALLIISFYWDRLIRCTAVLCVTTSGAFPIAVSVCFDLFRRLELSS